jgi:hypothetical protein
MNVCAVQFEVPGEKLAVLICCCIDCRAWSASPLNGATAFKSDELTVTMGQEFIFQKCGLKPPASVGKDPAVRRRRSKLLNPSTLVEGGSVKIQ